jgi:signal transduction histidine kinase
LSLEWFPADSIAEEIAGILRGKAKEFGVEVRLDIDPVAGDLAADRKAVRSLVVNLMENALDACRVDKKKNGHFIRLAVRGYPDAVEFEIEDNGIGMDRETRDKAFTLFFSSKGGDGTGLGLFIANRIVQAHGGKIQLESELNRGTRVTVRLHRRGPMSKTASSNPS